MQAEGPRAESQFVLSAGYLRGLACQSSSRRSESDRRLRAAAAAIASATVAVLRLLVQ